MSPDKLIYMANQIARSFQSRTYDEAVTATADHISNFWEPRMRSQLFALLDSQPDSFNVIVRDAKPMIRPVHAVAS
ncbi:MAG: formate dehydrogenase [Hyphomicrobiales bacterium]|nr:MAG: formate dehydrogenase [Hyphomicrobiales bacterium]